MEDGFSQLVERVQSLTGLGARDAFRVADSFEDEAVPTSAAIVDRAVDLGYDVQRKHEPAKPASPLPEITLDPAEVLAQVYRLSPRVLNVEFPRVGRAPKDSVFYSEEIQAQIDALPEEIRVLIADVDLVNGQVNVTLYDANNDLDRTIGPIDLDRYDSAQALHEAIMTLIKRLPRVLRADFN